MQEDVRGSRLAVYEDEEKVMFVGENVLHSFYGVSAEDCRGR